MPAHFPLADDRCFEAIAERLKPLGLPIRLEILWLLRNAEPCVGEISRRIGVSQDVISQHLALLMSRRLVSRRREANHTYYQARDEGISSLLDMLVRDADGQGDRSVLGG